MARRRRPGRGRRRRRPGGRSRPLDPAGSRGSRPRRCAARRSTVGRGEVARRAAPAAARAKGGRPQVSRLRPARSDAAASSGSAEGRRSGPIVQGLGVWPIAGSRQTGRWGQGRSSTVAQLFPDASPSLTSPLRRSWHGVWAGLRIMSDKAILSDIPQPRQAGRIPRQQQVTKRRQGFTMPQ